MWENCVLPCQPSEVKFSKSNPVKELFSQTNLKYVPLLSRQKPPGRKLDSVGDKYMLFDPTKTNHPSMFRNACTTALISESLRV